MRAHNFFYLLPHLEQSARDDPGLAQMEQSEPCSGNTYLDLFDFSTRLKPSALVLFCAHASDDQSLPAQNKAQVLNLLSSRLGLTKLLIQGQICFFVQFNYSAFLFVEYFKI